MATAMATETALVCVTIALPLVGILLALANGPRATTLKKPSRNVLLDNAKFICVTCVVFGHYVYYNIEHSTHLELVDYKTWLSGSESLLNLYTRLTPWTINMLCFVSGVVSRKPASPGRFRSLLLDLIAPTLLWEFVGKPCVLPFLVSPSYKTLIEILTELLSGKAYYREWYLEALIIWRVLAFVFNEMKPRVALLVAWVLSALGGYYSFGVMSIDEALGFLPFFVAGLVLPFEKLSSMIRRNTATITLGVVIVFTVAAVEHFIETNMAPLPDNHGTYGWFWAQKEFFAAQNASAEGSFIPLATYGFRRVARQCLEIFQGLAVLLTLIPRSPTLYTEFGRYTLYAFLLHETVLHLGNEVEKKLPMPIFTSTVMHGVVMGIMAVWLSCVVVFLGSKPTRTLFAPLLEPKSWLEPLLFPASKTTSFPKDEKVTWNPTFEDIPSGQPLLDEDHDSQKRDRSATSELIPSTLNDLLHPKFTKGRKSLFRQIDARIFAKYVILIPLSAVASMAFSVFFWMPILEKRNYFTFIEGVFWNTIREPLVQYLLVLSFVSFFLSDIITEAWTFTMLRRGLRRVPQPESLPKLVHSVVICQYKEPFEVLAATIESLTFNTKASRTIICLASEARDDTAQPKYEKLLAMYGHHFRGFLHTLHRLEEGEVVGKSSNENFAVRQLYRYAEEQQLDPFRVMVTVCDADSLFDTVFLEQLEGEFWRMPDGRRCLYDSPINTYRNLPECCLMTQLMEVSRCQFTLFSGGSFRPAQSNYSLTLGFAHELDYWDPSNTSEDFHTTLKAMAVTGSGSNVVVRVWSLILNDSVAGFTDRWTQAKRHMWGLVEEPVWIFAQFGVLRLNRWSSLLGLTMGSMLLQGSVVPAWLMLFFPPVWSVLRSLQPETIYLMIAYVASIELYKWIKAIVREFFLYQNILAHRSHVMPMSRWQWIRLFCAYPLTEFVACFFFNTLATWRMLWHAVHQSTLHYVTAPKAFNVVTSPEADSTNRTATSRHQEIRYNRPAAYVQRLKQPSFHDSSSSNTSSTMSTDTA